MHIVDLRTEEDPAKVTVEILDGLSQDDLKRRAREVALAGQIALQVTADGIRDHLI
jgi:hypothetical protein